MAADTPLERPGTRSASTAKPLRRKPKQLDEEPTLYEAAPGAGVGSVRLVPEGRAARTPGRRGGSAPGITDETAELTAAQPGEPAHDSVTRSRARQIAARLAVPRPRTDATSRRGSGDLASVRYRGGSDDIDIDRTLEVLAERPVPEDEDIIVRERVRARRSVVLAVDVSGSMRGERVRTAAATVGALAGELGRDDLAVVAFWSEAAVLHRPGQPVRPMELLDTLLALPAEGLTNVFFPLHVAARELARVPGRDARVVLLSDCVHNAGPDPRPVASGLPRLDVLLDVTGEHDLELGRDLARLGHGRTRRVRRHQDVAPALSDLFAD